MGGILCRWQDLTAVMVDVVNVVMLEVENQSMNDVENSRMSEWASMVPEYHCYQMLEVGMQV